MGTSDFKAGLPMNFKLMNNFIKDYGILRIGLGICGVREEGKMCEALMKLMEPEVKEVVNKAVVQDRKNIVVNAVKNGSSVEDISRVMGIPLAEVEAIAKGI